MQLLMTLFNWYAKLTKSLVNRDFKPSHIDPRLYHSWTICERHRLLRRVLKYESENFILTDDADDPENVLSWTGMVIIYANCPILWRSSQQTELALSTAKAEYIELSSALR